MTDTPTSASPAGIRGITYPRGFRAAGGTCGIKESGKPDLVLIVADRTCAAAAMFTTNKVPGAPVIVSRRHVKSGKARAIVINSGCSNVATGKAGERDAETMCQTLAGHVGCPPTQVLVCSTGIIGRRLPMPKITPGIASLFGKLASGPATDSAVATAILTTDLVTKTAFRAVTIAGKEVRIAGIAKGSGMIQPNMATMLAFITTDAAISAPMLRAGLKEAVNATFNRLSVDHDTSTSDSAMLLASAEAGNKPITAKGRALAIFTTALKEVCAELAYQIVKDGEGATKVFRVNVTGARSVRDADRVGHTITGSPLVKTAVHGADPNWGRLAMAVGRSGAAVDPAKLTLTIGGVTVFRKGVNLNADLAPLEAHMKGREITFDIDLGLGRHTAQWLGCDLSRQYIAINADYTT
jgi:glutamate N-acetyltransferase/amino-acid N-acetyltransferase